MGLPPPTKESEVEKTARFTRQFLKGIVVFLVIIIIVAGVGAFWFLHQEPTVKNTVTPTPTASPIPNSTPTPTNGTNFVGVNVGDTFTYKLRGDSVLFSSDTTTPAYLSEYNNTDYYQVTITGISGTQVSLNTLWRLTNG